MSVPPLTGLWAAALKEQRLVARKSIDEAAVGLGQDRSLISRFERGQRIPNPKLLGRLLDCYEVTGSDRDEILATAHALQVGGWWSPHTEDVNRQLLDYVWCEWHATEIQLFEPMLIGGLAQTPGYMEALTSQQSSAKSPAQARRWIRFRQRRQSILDQDGSPKLRMVLYEPALRCPVGGADVMREQFDHLINMEEFEDVEIRVLTYEQAARIPLQGQFTVFYLPQPLDTAAVVQTSSAMLFLDSRTLVDDQCEDFTNILSCSLSASESMDFIAELRKKLK